MASKFGADVTGLSDVNVGEAMINTPTPNINSRSSAAKLLSGLISEGIDQYETGKLKTETEQAIHGYFADPAMEQNVQMLEEQTAGAFTPEEDVALSEAKERLSRLRSAYNATNSPISDIELKARVESITKAYINRFPTIADSFRTVAANELGDYAVRIAMLQKARTPDKSQAEMEEWLTKEAIKKGLDAIGRPIGEWYPQLLKINNDETITGTAKNLRDRNVVQRQLILNDPEVWKPVTRTTIRTYNTDINSIVKSGRSVSEKLAELERISAVAINDVSSYNPAGTSDPKVTSLIDTISKLKETYSAIIQGKPEAESMSNKVTMVTKANELGLLQDPELSGMIMANKIFPDLMVSLMQTNSEAMTDMGDAITRVMGGDYPFTQTVRSGEERVRDRKMTNFFRSLQKAIGIANGKRKSVEPQDIKFVNESLNAVIDNIHKEKSAAAYDGLLEFMADPEFVEYQKNFIPGELKSKMAGPVNTFITDSVLGAFDFKYNPKNMKLISTTDGRLMVLSTTNDPVVKRDVDIINRDYIPRLNKYTAASAHLQGSTNYQSVAEKFRTILEETGKRSTERYTTGPESGTRAAPVTPTTGSAAPPTTRKKLLETFPYESEKPTFETDYLLQFKGTE